MTEDHGAIALGERVLGILNEGGFSATYKFALFTAILDLCIEKKNVKGEPPETLTTRQLAEKVIELYWSHVTPYGPHGTLRQGGGRDEQASIVRRIAEARAQWSDAAGDTLCRFRQRCEDRYRRLVHDVEWTLIKMPIPRLQKLGRHEDRFLYDYGWTEDIRHSTVTSYQRGGMFAFHNTLRLQSGVADHLVQLNGILRPLFYRAWAGMVARLNGLPESKLERFLFGSDRTPLQTVRGPLRELQENRCFYCEHLISGEADVDHFVPWSRYPDDGIDNLVAAHPRCNNSKRDFLAAAEHVEHWKERGLVCGHELSAIAVERDWARDADRTRSAARAIYTGLPATARLWAAPSVFEPHDRRRILEALDDWRVDGVADATR